MAGKENDYEKKHKIRGIYGNGLRPEVWKVVQERFGINKIIEFYGSSEGNVSLTNVDSEFGSIGRIPPYLKGILPTKIVKFDVENEVVIRNEEGFCIECENDEAGEAIGFIPNDDKLTGTISIVRKNASGETIVVVSSAGTIDYVHGEINLSTINIISTDKPNNIVEVQAFPESNDIIGLQDLYLEFNISNSTINMVKDTITSGEQISGVGYKVTSSYANGELTRT